MVSLRSRTGIFSAALGLGFFGLVAGLLQGTLLAADAPIHVSFDQNRYEVEPGEAFSVSVVLPQVPNGLFSYGVQLSLPAGKVAGAASDSIVVPIPINFNGTAGSGAFKEVQSGLLGVKGTVDFSSVNAPYRGALLTTFNLQNQAGKGESYTLTLDIFRTLGPSETVFVDGAGVGLDSTIIFDSAVVDVVPEPSITALLAMPFAFRLIARLVTKGSKA